MTNSVNYKKKSKRSRGRKRRFGAILTIVILLLIGGLLVRGLHRNAPQLSHQATAISNPHPVVSSAPWTPSERATVVADLRTAFAPAIEGIHSYSLIVIDGRGRTLFDDRSFNAVAPASVQKLVVADTSMNLLGPAYRFHTIAAAERPIGADGVLSGDLWIVGSGDPSLRSTTLRDGIATLARSGLKTISGAVAVDPTAMHGPEINPHWNPEDANEDFQAPTSAVSIDEDTAEFRVFGTTPGSPARIVIVPASGAIQSSGSVTTSSSSDDVIIAAMEDPNTFRYSGTIPAGVEEKFWLPVHDIPRYVGSVVATMLHRAGISTAAPPTVAAAPMDSIVLWDHASAPLLTLERHMLYVSDNHYAEQLLRIVGGESGAIENDRDGIAQETQFLHSRDIPTPGMHLVDGSGLAESNRIAAVTLGRILSDAQLRDGGAELQPLLPAGGKDGTLQHYDFTSALGRVRAKTGHLSDAASLAGYVDSRHHGRLVFAFMVNGSPGDPDAAYVRAVDALATF